MRASRRPLANSRTDRVLVWRVSDIGSGVIATCLDRDGLVDTAPKCLRRSLRLPIIGWHTTACIATYSNNIRSHHYRFVVPPSTRNLEASSSRHNLAQM